jgi:medium-chain acyl-[acyl-carrier-protein] hydrolase
MQRKPDHRPNRWLLKFRESAPGAPTLVGIPYAGGGASLFASWTRWLPPAIGVVGVQLPGRERRLNEPPLNEITQVVAELGPAVLASLRGPLALFGHSNGALIAFELARWLRPRVSGQVWRLYVAASRAPQVVRPLRNAHLLPDAEFREHLRKLGGTPTELLEDDDAVSVLSPMLRGDLCMNDTYRYVSGAPMDCAIIAFGGRDDVGVPETELGGWSDHTTAGFRLTWLDGDHFFVKEPGPLLRHIADDLSPGLPRSHGRGIHVS